MMKHLFLVGFIFFQGMIYWRGYRRLTTAGMSKKLMVRMLVGMITIQVVALVVALYMT